MSNIENQSFYYRTDIPAVKQFSNLPRENFSLKTKDLPGAQPKQILPERKNKAEDFIENYLNKERIQGNFQKSNPVKIRNPLYADYSPGYSSPNIDSLDQFKNEYNFQENTNAKNQNQYYEDQNLQNVYKQYEELPQKQQTNSNELSKNLANFYGVTPPRTGTINNNLLSKKLETHFSEEKNSGRLEFKHPSQEALFNKNAAVFYGVTPPPSNLASHRNSYLKKDPDYQKSLAKFYGSEEEKNSSIAKNLKQYKTPELKYKGFYNPISHKKIMEYVPKFQVMVQVESEKNFRQVNDEIRSKYVKNPVNSYNESDIYKTENKNYGYF